MNDMGGKKIWADCSIIEFKYAGAFYKCVFSWSDAYLKYQVSIVEKDNTFGNVKWNYNPIQYHDFKVIDTVKENKLGLIK